MSNAADGGRDVGDLPDGRGEEGRLPGLGVSGADDGALPASDATEKALHVQSLDIPAVAAQLSLSPRGLLSRLLRGGEGEEGGNVVTVNVPVVRDEDHDDRVTDHDARSGLSSSLLSRRARRAEAADSENAAASHALFAATATPPPPRLSRGSAATRRLEDEHLESLVPLLQRTAGTSRRAPSGRPDDTTPVSSPRVGLSADSPLGYLVGVPVGSTLVPDAFPDGRDVEDVEACLARAVAYATDGEVGESEAVAAADAAAAAARIGRDDASTGLAADDDVLVRRVIFAVPSRTSFGLSGAGGLSGTASAGTDSGAQTGDAYASSSNVGSERRLKFGGASTRFSLPTAVTNVTLEMRNPKSSRDDATSSTRGRRRIESESESETKETSAFLVDARDGDETLDVARYVTRCSDASDASASASSFFGDSSVRGDVADFSSTRNGVEGVSLRKLRASVVVERRVPVIGWLVLAAAVVSLSAMGTMVTLERSKPFTQSTWRAQSVLLIALPWALVTGKKQGLRGFRVKRVRRRAFCVACCWSGWFLTLFYGLATTSIAHAYVLTNTTGAFIVVHKVLTRNAVPRSHFVGVALATAGAGVVMWQSSVKGNEASSGRGSATVAGDAVVAAGAISGAAFLVLAKGVREEMELSLLVVLQMLVNLPISLALAVTLERCSFASPFDKSRGVFGWLTEAQIGKQLVISVCGTIVGTCGYIASLKYLAPTVVANAMLLEPILAALIGWAAGVTAFPDWKTCSGMGCVAFGTAVIAVDAGRARVRTVDVDAHRNG
jgi:drug/metabolite transporter (DMT)-like permease